MVRTNVSRIVLLSSRNGARTVMETRQEQGNVVVGVFATREQAQSAIQDLQRAGFDDESLGYASKEPEPEGADMEVEDIEERDEEATSGAVGGVATGGMLGGVLGAGAALLIPGVGPVVAAGILAAGVAGGAFAGGLVGPFVNMGVPEEEAQIYDKEFKSGRSLVTVHPGNREGEARQILGAAGASNVHNE
ncbi:hypothetical protein BH23CHL1_BH23CHL1_19590 [soil metagenome]